VGLAEFVGAFTLIFHRPAQALPRVADIVAVALANGLRDRIMVSNLATSLVALHGR